MGVRKEAYLLSPFWEDGLPELVNKNPDFDNWFHDKFQDFKQVKLYRSIKDQELLAKKASFPMHSFQLKDDDSFLLPVAFMRNVRLLKTWSRIEYYIDVITPLEIEDSSWIAGKARESYETGQEVGCRLEFHRFDTSQVVDELIQSIILDYDTQKGFSGNHSVILPTIMKLKARKVVVVELCGC